MTVENKDKPVVKEDATQAQSTLAPGAGSSKGELMTVMNNVMLGMGVEDLSKFLNDSLATIGHEADGIPGGASAQNQASIAAKGAPTVTKEDLDALFEGQETITEDHKAKFSNLFEAAVVARVGILEANINETYEAKLVEEVEKTKSQLDDYLTYVVENWMKENEVAITSALKTEIHEDFIAGIKKVFVENFIDVPDEKLDVLATVSEERDALKAQLEESQNTIIELNKSVKVHDKDKAFSTVSEGLTLVDAEKLKVLAEDVAFENPEQYVAAVKVLKEKISTPAPASGTGLLEETFEAAPAEKVVTTDPRMSAYARALDVTTRR